METWAGVKVARNPDWRRCDDIEHVEIFTNQATRWMEIWIYGNMTSSASCENCQSWWLNEIQYLHQASLTFSFKIIEKRNLQSKCIFLDGIHLFRFWYTVAQCYPPNLQLLTIAPNHMSERTHVPNALVTCVVTVSLLSLRAASVSWEEVIIWVKFWEILWNLLSRCFKLAEVTVTKPCRPPTHVLRSVSIIKFQIHIFSESKSHLLILWSWCLISRDIKAMSHKVIWVSKLCSFSSPLLTRT